MYVQVVTLALFMPLAAAGQEFRATIAGTVKDSSGAAIPGVTITVVETRTGTKSETVSDTAGQYVVPFLAPGDYEIHALLQGFKEFSRKAVHLASGDHLVVDAVLEVGDVAESVSVTADAPLINTANSSTGQTITTKQVEDLPLNGRNPMMLAQLAIGVIATGTPSLVHPFDNGAAAAWSIGGTPAQTSEILLDGSPNATWDNRLAYSPPQDSVQELRVKAFDADAAYGHTGSGTINKIMKTGTNAFHGSAYEFTQPSVLGANTLFNNRAGLGNPATKLNQYGLTAGGPVVIPRTFDGHNRLFWFFAFERLKDSQPNTNFTTVPTDAERQGDFSALSKISPSYQIYNPFTGVLNGTTVMRQPFANNVIPQELLNPIALAYLKYYPLPNVAGRSDGFQNYGNTSTTDDDYSNELGRFDYNVSSRSRIAFNVRHNNQFQTKNNYFGNVATGSNLTRENWGATLDDVYTLGSSTVLDVRFNFTRMNEVHDAPGAGVVPSSVGFPSYLDSSSQFLQLPFVGFAGSCGSQTSFQCLGDSGASRDPSQSYQVFADVVKIARNHALKFGADVRQYRLDNIAYGNSAGSYTFNTNWTRGPNAGSAAANLGQDFASFLLGLPTSGQFDLNSSGSFRSYYYALFLQDDWRVKPNLTVNLGVRFDRDTPYVEQLGRTVNGFATDVQNPLAQAAIAAYAKNPISQIPAASFAVPGGLTFATPGDGAVYRNTSQVVSPRVGFAWSPQMFHETTVIRGGLGVYVQPITIANLSFNGNYSSTPIVDQQGFSQTTLVIVPNNFQQPTTTLSNPFPGGIVQPTGPKGLSTFVGQTVQFLNPQMRNPQSLRWTLGVQRELARNLVVEIAYIGNHATNLPVAVTQLNGIPRQYLSTLPTRDQTVISALTATVQNPFAGLLPGTGLNNQTTTVAQLLAHYPQYPVGVGSGSTGVIEQNNNVGSSRFQSLNVRLEKRLSNGLSLIGTYIHSRLIERSSWLNDSDPLPEERVSPFDHPNRFITAVSYELPFGQGKPVNLQSGLANLVFGGWHVNGIYTYQTGAPLVWVNGSTTSPGDYGYFGGPLNLNSRQVNGPAFDISQFATASAQQLQFHVRTFPTTFDNWRQDSTNNFDASVLKRFELARGTYLQLRFEAFNVLNRVTYGAPNTTVANTSFGFITTQSNRPRQIQLGARFVF
jgi:hypothetical protein